MFLGRWSMLHGWLELFRTKFGRKKNEFVSADARHLSNDPRTYEMLSGTGTQLNIRTPDRVLSPNPREGMSPGPDLKQDYLGTARAYVNPVSSYSYPRPPSQQKDWDPRSTHASPGVAYDMKSYPG